MLQASRCFRRRRQEPLRGAKDRRSKPAILVQPPWSRVCSKLRPLHPARGRAAHRSRNPNTRLEPLQLRQRGRLYKADRAKGDATWGNPVASLAEAISAQRHAFHDHGRKVLRKGCEFGSQCGVRRTSPWHGDVYGLRLGSLTDYVPRSIERPETGPLAASALQSLRTFTSDLGLCCACTIAGVCTSLPMHDRTEPGRQNQSAQLSQPILPFLP